MPTRVAILGGGPAGLATALELTDPRRGVVCDVTIYQQGGRLGGKCASSRNPAVGERNEEHGLHVWFGCYENAFGVMARVYEDHPSPPFPTIWDAFTPRPYTVLGQGTAPNFDRWEVNFPSMPGRPGDGSPLREPTDVIGFMLEVFYAMVISALEGARAATTSLFRDAALLTLELEFRALMSPILMLPGARAADALLTLANAVGGLTLMDVLGDAFARVILEIAGGVPAIAKPIAAADILLAGLRGLLSTRDNALKDLDFDVLDKYEFSDWLKRNGARQESLDSAFIRAVYECMFEYTNGDRKQPSYAAGVALRAMLRIGATYKGEVLYLPKAGVGELVISPIYEVLRARGVTFKFFHRVMSLEPDASGDGIGSVVLSEQALVTAGEYHPLVALHLGGIDMKVWRSEPDWSQLFGGVPSPKPDFESYWDATSIGTRTLVAGTDFDTVVLAIPVTALREVAAPLIAIRSAWRNMVNAMPGVPNCAMQLWMDRSVAQLGWTEAPALDAGPTPFDVWCDMSESLLYENWPSASAPRSAHYLCGVLETDLHLRDRTQTSTPHEAAAQVRNRAIAFLETDAYALWPGVYAPGQVFRWDCLVAPAGVLRQQRIDHQFLRANIDPSEVTHASPPGSTAQRLYAGHSQFNNLVLAGDWVRNGLNSAAIEAAIMGGRQAARAITHGSWSVPGEYWMSRPPAYLPALGAPPPLAPTYVDRVGRGEQAMPFPGVMRDADLQVFVLQGQAARAQSLVDRFLNNPSGQPGKYVVDTDMVLVSFMDAKMTSGGASVGWLPDRECAVWIAVKSGGRRLFWMPYILVDTSIAMVTGREIWGFAKELGRMDYAPGVWRALGTTFDPLDAATKGVEGELVVAEQTGIPGLIGGLVSSISGLAGLAAGFLVDELFGVPQPRVVNLKQFRDASAPGKAAYQSIVESRFDITNLVSAGIMAGTFEVRFPVHASHSIAPDLGLQVVNPVLAAFTIRMDFEALAGVEVWKAR